MKRKDALTDLIEYVQSAPQPEGQSDDSEDRQVVNSAGETITLGQEQSKNTSISNKSVSLELQQIVEVVRRAVERSFNKAISRLRNHE